LLPAERIILLIEGSAGGYFRLRADFKRVARDKTGAEMNTEITFSFIIPHRPGESAGPLLRLLGEIDYPPENIEIIVVQGRNPALQRNAGAYLAEGDFLFFLDHDCIPSPGLLKEALRALAAGQERAEIVGGPCIMLPLDSSNILYLHTLVSFFSHYKMRARYIKLGEVRESGEKELIGCNLMIKRSVFKALGGFKETLYPNEENELLNRAKLSHHKIVYSPEVLVAKEMKLSAAEYCRKIFRYGNGRGRELFEEPLRLNLMYFLPPLFCLYLAGAVFIRQVFYFIPLAVYFSVSFFSGLVYMFRQKKVFLCWAPPLVFTMMHLSYGLGMWSAVFRRFLGLKPGGNQYGVEVNRVKKFGAAGLDDETVYARQDNFKTE